MNSSNLVKGVAIHRIIEICKNCRQSRKRQYLKAVFGTKGTKYSGILKECLKQ